MKPPSLLARLWREYVSRYAGEVAVLVPVLALVAFTGVSYAGILKFATDAITAGAWPQIVFWVMIAVALAAARAFAMWAQAVLSQGLSLKVLRDLQGAMFGKLLISDYARHAREEPGKLVSRFTNDINVVSEALVRGGQTAVRDTLTLIGAIGWMLWLDWVLTLVVLAVFALAAAPMQAIAASARKRTLAAQQQIGALSAVLFESFDKHGLCARRLHCLRGGLRLHLAARVVDDDRLGAAGRRAHGDGRAQPG